MQNDKIENKVNKNRKGFKIKVWQLLLGGVIICVTVAVSFATYNKSCNNDLNGNSNKSGMTLNEMEKAASNFIPKAKPIIYIYPEETQEVSIK